VHARAGERERYAPVQNAAGWPIDPGNAETLVEVYTQVLGILQIYEADLDAILRQMPQHEVTKRLASRAPLWVDAGVRSVNDARRVIELGASRVIVGLETLPSFEVLSDICRWVGRDRVAFSLDVRNGQPVVTSGTRVDDGVSSEEMVEAAVISGVNTLIVVDLARVGTDRGVDIDLLNMIHSVAPGLTLVAGGGVRGWDDLVRLAGAGCNGALVATALHDGRIGPTEISEAQKL
jgi:phosphoribosylformimino-5-aminoimidazole carboxamide ribotide isomerase